MRIQSAFEKAGILFLDDDAGGGTGFGWVRSLSGLISILRNKAKIGTPRPVNGAFVLR
jgi:hypothetical protein